jgi:protein-L-isoaspartate(D-aspartate) O-methyltransferase
MFTELELAITRRAKQVLFASNLADEELEAAITRVKREDFLGPGPWPVFRWGVYVSTPSADPVYLYTDNLIGIMPEKGLNNGQPSFPSFLIANAVPKSGEHVVHIGAGVGYYMAIMAELVGPNGHVTAIEHEEDLAFRAEHNCANRKNVRVVAGDGTLVRFDGADAILVNPVQHGPPTPGSDALKECGRLILPLTTNQNFQSPVYRPPDHLKFPIGKL